MRTPSPALSYSHENREALLKLICDWCASHITNRDSTAHTVEFWWCLFYDQLPLKTWTGRDIGAILRAPYDTNGTKHGIQSSFRVIKYTRACFTVERVFHDKREKPPTRFNRQEVI